MNDHATTQAALLEAHGVSFRLATVPRPTAGEGEVLVRVAASRVNPPDLNVRAGTVPHARQTLPAIFGIDLAGTVVATAPGVTRVRPGDEVFGMIGGVGGHQVFPLLDPWRFALDSVGEAYRPITEGKAQRKLSIDIDEEAGL